MNMSFEEFIAGIINIRVGLGYSLPETDTMVVMRYHQGVILEVGRYDHTFTKYFPLRKGDEWDRLAEEFAQQVNLYIEGKRDSVPHLTKYTTILGGNKVEVYKTNMS